METHTAGEPVQCDVCDECIYMERQLKELIQEGLRSLVNIVKWMYHLEKHLETHIMRLDKQPVKQLENLVHNLEKTMK
jgi:hypothetical protein